MADSKSAMVPDSDSLEDRFSIADSIVPYFDSFEDGFSIAETVRMLDENPTLLDFDEFPSTRHKFSLDRSDANVPLPDPVVSTNPDQAGPSQFHGETTHQQGILQPDDLGLANPVQLPGFWPETSVPYGGCSCCQVLREMIHTKGMHATKLEIHGRFGLMISHAIENQFVNSDWTTSYHHQMIDFSNQSMEAVKEYLVLYCEGRKQEGYSMQQDPLRTFYEALCVGLTNSDDNLAPHGNIFQPSSAYHSGEDQVNVQAEAVNQNGATRDEIRRLSIAAQRQRTKNLTVKDLAGYFNLPIEDAANQLRLSPTVMKNICRKHGLKRWPHRKIKSIERKISNRRKSLKGNDEEEKARAQNDIEGFEQELASIFACIGLATEDG